MIAASGIANSILDGLRRLRDATGLPLVTTRKEAHRAMPSSTREQCLQRAEEYDRLGAEMNGHVRETMLFLATRWRALAAEPTTPPTSNVEDPRGNGS